jgi:hypothetical protein
MDMNTGVETFLGKIDTPSSTFITSVNNFTELWGGANDCDAQSIKGSAIVNYHRPTSDNVAHTATWTQDKLGSNTFVPFPGSNTNLFVGTFSDVWSGYGGKTTSAVVSAHVICAAGDSAVNVDRPTCMRLGHYGQDCNAVCGGAGHLDTLHFPSGQAVTLPQCVTNSLSFLQQHAPFRGDSTEAEGGKWGCSMTGPPGNPGVWRHTNGTWDASARDDNIARFCACMY